MIFNKKFLITAMLTIILIFFLFITRQGTVNFLDSASVIPMLVFTTFISFISFRFFYNFRKFRRRDMIIALIGSIFLSILFVFGFQLDNTDSYIINIKIIFSIVTIGTMFFAIITNLLDSTDKITEFDFKYDVKFLNKLLSRYIYIWMFIFLLTIPYIIALNPGALSPDSYNILLQVTGGTELSSGHPVFYTLVVKCFYSVTEFLGLSMYYTVLFYSIAQALAMSSIFAYAVYTLQKINCKLYYIIFVLVFYALFPLFPVYNVTLWKDVVFGGMILLYTIFLYKARIEEKFFANIKNLVKLAAITLGVLLFRTNGILVVVMSLPFILVIFKKHFLKTLAVTVIPVAIYILFITVGFNLLDVQDFRKNEAFSIPYQHLARIYTEETELAPEDQEFLEKVFTKDEEMYNPRISDISRVYCANIEYFDNNTDEFFDNWFRLVKKYPKTLLKSFLNNNFGYWYPDSTRQSVCPVIYDNSPYISLTPSLEAIERKFSEHGGSFVVYLLMFNTVSKRLTSVGLAYTVLAVLFLVKLSQKNKKATILFIPAFALWIGVILGSPVYAEFRYVFGLFASLPFIIGAILFSPKNDLES